MKKPSPDNLLPVVLRARDFRLYTQGGGRLVDLWQAGGRAILGHSPAGVVKDLKNSAGRGLFAPFPHPQEGRLRKALAQILPGRSFRFYRDLHSLYRALAAASFPCEDPFADPVFPSGGIPGPQVSLWRPFLGPAAKPPSPWAGAGIPVLVPILPWPLAPWVLALDPSLDGLFAPAEPLPPALLAAAARAVYDLIAAGPGGGRPVYPRLNRVLYGSPQGGGNTAPAAGEDDAPPQKKPWRRQGLYLTHAALQPPGPGSAPPCPAWEALFRRFLAGGFLIPPSPREPLILPGTLSPGEETKLAALLGEAPEPRHGNGQTPRAIGERGQPDTQALTGQPLS